MSEDTMDATAGLIARLDAAETEPGVVRLRHRSYELLELSPGASVVDVGCGTGRATAELRQRGTAAIGVDPDELMIATARRRWTAAEFRMAKPTPLRASARSRSSPSSKNSATDCAPCGTPTETQAGASG